MPSEWRSERCWPVASDRMPDADSPDHSSATVLISTSRTALNHRCAALHGIAPPVGGLRHTRKQKSARAEFLQRATFRNIRAKKKPRDAAGLFRKLSASPFWRLGD